MKVWITVMERDDAIAGTSGRAFASTEAVKAAYPQAVRWVEERYANDGSLLGEGPDGWRTLAIATELEGDDHFVTLHQGGWDLTHSPSCIYNGLDYCRYWKAIDRIYAGTGEEEYGRWRIDDIDSEGMPGLVRA